MSTQGKNLVSFITGAAIGTAIGVVLAPTSGSETRRKLAESAEQGRAFLADSGMEYVEKGRELYDKGHRLADEAAEMFDEGRKMVEG